jgi:hypothetical protein
MYHAQIDEERVFLGLTLKSSSTITPGFTLKHVVSSFPVYASKLAATVW